MCTVYLIIAGYALINLFIYVYITINIIWI